MKQGRSFFVHPSSEVEPGAQVGSGTKIWRFCHVMAGARIGARCSLGQGCFVAGGASIADDCRIQNHVSVFAGVELDAFVFCGPNVSFSNVRFPRVEHPTRPEEYHCTRVGRGASLGANASIVCGNTIGPYAVVGAGAVVTRDVAAFSVVVGSPARHVGWVSQAGARLTFTEGEATCAKTGAVYLMEGADRVRAAP